MAKDLRAFLDELRAVSREDLLVIEKPVNAQNYDVTAILEHLTQRGKFPVTLFTRPTNLRGEPAEFSLISNVFATRERCARALGLEPSQARMELSLEYARREKQPVAPVTISSALAPVQQVVKTGADADLRQLPIVRHFHMDVAPVLTMAFAMRDPDNGCYDVSFIKTFYLDDPFHTGVSIHSPHLERILARYEELGEPAPIIQILGHHPAFFLGSLALAPFGNDDYATIGGFLGEPLRLVPSVTWGDRFLVPADAEIVLEGEIPPGAREVVDPFGEVTRTYQAQCLRQGMDVKAITYRQHAIMQDIFSGHQGHWNLGAIPKEGSVYNALQQRYGNIVAVHMPQSGCGRLACYVSIRKTREGEAKRVGISTLNETWMFQWVVIVDEDVDVFNEQDVIWAMITQVNPTRDVDLIQNAYTLFTNAMGYNKLIIDATKPMDIAFPEKVKVPDEAMRRIRLEDFVEGI